MTGFALLIGLPSEPPIVAVAHELERMRAPHFIVNQRHLISGAVTTSWGPTGSGGVISVDELAISLSEVTGVYTRVTTWGALPEVVANPDLLDHAREMHNALEAWLETTSATVINRTSANDSNNSKPYQALLIRDYFDVPATLVTNDPAAVVQFRQEIGPIIYKSASGERSIVSSFADEDIARLAMLKSCPVQFQEHVRGVDVRAHVVGDEVFAVCIESGAVDWRYDREGTSNLTPINLPPSVVERCIAVTARLGLELAGIDLRFADDGRVVCFEVNPSPAYTAFGDETANAIAHTIARRLLMQ